MMCSPKHRRPSRGLMAGVVFLVLASALALMKEGARGDGVTKNTFCVEASVSACPADDETCYVLGYWCNINDVLDPTESEGTCTGPAPVDCYHFDNVNCGYEYSCGGTQPILDGQGHRVECPTTTSVCEQLA